MSRHRNVRTMNYEEDFFDDDDVYGHSVEDNYCISPGTVSQFTFNRDAQHDLTHYMGESRIPEEDNEDDSDEDVEPLNDSSGCGRPKLNAVDDAKLNTCLEGMRNILGETFPEHVMVETAVKNNFDLSSSLNQLLSQQDAPKPQRQPREKRRNRSEASPKPPVMLLKDPVPRQTKSDTQAVSTAADDLSSLSLQSSEGSNTPAASKASSASSIAITKPDILSNGMGAVDEISSPDKPETQTDSVVPQTPKKDQMTSVPPLPRSSSKTKEKLNLQKEYEKRREGKDLLNLVVIGHVDAGKSTLMGHLLYQLGNVNRKMMHKYEQESRKVGKSSFAFAWVLDETEEERSRGVTMDIAQTRFETPHRLVTLLDAPGHKDFIPNMITGAAQADVGILVVNATKGEFETGFESGGQTREHALLSRSLGISQLIIAVNKMDTVDWAQERYDDIVKKLGQFLKQVGYKEADFFFVPCSGLSGENLTQCAKEPKLSSWYTGTTLVQQIDNFKPVTRSIDKPFRLTVADVFKGMGSGFSITGRINAGSVQNGDRMCVMPSADNAVIKGILQDEMPIPYAFAGDHVTMTITGLDITKVNMGNVICDMTNPVKVATRIRARVVIFNLKMPITRGFMVVYHYQTITEPAIIKRLVSQLNRSTGEVTHNHPKCLTKNSSAVVEIEFERPICLELYKDYKDLGRFMLRAGGVTIAAGMIEEVLKVKTKDEQAATNY
ncbi:hypothetical protein ScPMuIL_005294 [Solemya velum]